MPEDARHHTVAPGGEEFKGAVRIVGCPAVEGVPCQGLRPVEARLDDVLGDAQRQGRLRRGKPFDFSQHEHGPVRLRERVDDPFKKLAELAKWTKRDALRPEASAALMPMRMSHVENFDAWPKPDRAP